MGCREKGNGKKEKLGGYKKANGNNGKKRQEAALRRYMKDNEK